MKILANLDLVLNELQNARIQSLASDPITENIEARIYYNSTTKKLKYYDGTQWKDVGTDVVVSADEQGHITINGTQYTVYTLPNATTETKGGIIVGSHLAINNGTLSVVTSDTYASASTDPASVNAVRALETAISTNLVNNYYNKTEVDAKIAAIPTIQYTIVATLPTADETTYFNNSKTIYLVAVTGTGNDNYDEFICMRSGTEGSYTYSWEKIGNTRIDLTNYYTKAQTISKINELTTEVNTNLGAYRVDVASESIATTDTTLTSSVDSANFISYFANQGTDVCVLDVNLEGQKVVYTVTGTRTSTITVKTLYKSNVTLQNITQ